jgi:hypothetical protein
MKEFDPSRHPSYVGRDVEDENTELRTRIENPSLAAPLRVTETKQKPSPR